MTHEDLVRVLYIGGAGRSGSTILCRVLGAQPQFVTVGEVCLVWKFGVIENRRCSCGEPFSSCSFWQDVADAAPGLFELESSRRYSAYFDSVLQMSRRLPWLWTAKGRQRLLDGMPDSYSEDLSRLYRAISTVSGAKVVVDGSKLPTYDYLLRFVSDLDVTRVQFVRDARAVAFSWLREQKRVGKHGASEPEYMSRRGTLVSSLDWDLLNLAVNKVGSVVSNPARLLRYEDFVAEPAAVIEDLVSLMGETFSGENPSASGEVLLSDEHVFGNPNRFESGRLSIRPDNEWQVTMPTASRVLITAITAPLLIRYGYPINPPAKEKSG